MLIGLGALVGNLTGFVLVGCPSSSGPPPTVPVVDADAAPFVLSDAADASLCEQACAILDLSGCWTIADCPSVLSALETNRSVRMPSGYPLTCAAIVGAQTLSEVGILCDGGGQP